MVNNNAVTPNSISSNSNLDLIHPLALDMKSDYHEIDDMIKISEKVKGYSYTALQINLQSLPAKHSDLQLLCHKLESMNVCVDFIMVCETFLKDSNQDLYHIPGYKLVAKNRLTRKGGGVGIFIKEKYEIMVQDDMGIFEEGEFESLVV